jgi:hypothetical protein
MPRYWDLIVGILSQDWSIGHITREPIIVRPDLNTTPLISETILSQISTMKRFRIISRSRNPEHCNVDFHMLWDPVFFESQDYGVDYSTFTGQAITLTGQDNDA